MVLSVLKAYSFSSLNLAYSFSSLNLLKAPCTWWMGQENYKTTCQNMGKYRTLGQVHRIWKLTATLECMERPRDPPPLLHVL